jgi:hypothetical protein
MHSQTSQPARYRSLDEPECLPRSNFFGDPKPTQKTAGNWLKKAWLVNLSGKFFNYMDIRSSFISYFLIANQKLIDQQNYKIAKKNSMTSVELMIMGHKKVGIPVYEKMEEDVQSGCKVDMRL